jgi:Uma2 family endonuclease
MLTATAIEEIFTLEDYLKNPPEHMEWVDGQLLEKNGMTLPHGEIQLNLGFYWRSYAISSGQGGKVYTDTPCRTIKQGRRPDVAYLTPELAAQYGKAAALPMCFPLLGEIASPTDYVEEFFAKAKEYLDSGCQEVWLILPESKWIFVITQTQRLWFASGDVASTQAMLPGFRVAVDELFA